MKKRLLITSIIMMLVVALTLSTATYAWFTSNTTVTASTITLNAESGAGVALGIGWLGGPTSTLIEANTGSNYKPMVPSALVVDNGNNTPTNFNSVTWSGATTYVDGVAKFNAPYNPAPTPYQYNGDVADESVYVFYIENLSQANIISSITMTLSGVTDTNNLVRVAVFTSNTEGGNGNDYVLKAVLSDTANLDTEWGTILAAGQVVSDLCADGDEVSTVTSYVITNLEAQAKVYFKVVVWLDGVALDDSTASSSCTLGLNFQAA